MPDEEAEIGDLDFAGEMHHLAYEAQLKAPSSSPRLDRKELTLALGQMLRPLALELETIKRATADNSVLLTILNKAAKAPALPSQAEPDGYERIIQQLQRLSSVESNNQKLFDALHTELKGYKDNFLFDALQRPFIRDLVSIFDDFSSVHVQVCQRLTSSETSGQGAKDTAKNSRAPDAETEEPAGESETDFLRTLAGNLENQIHHLLEVFLRMEVVLSQSPAGTMLDKKMHRTVAFEAAAEASRDGQVFRSLKPGFTWRERMIRPEEVVVYRSTSPIQGSTGQVREESAEAKPAAVPESRRGATEGKITKQR